MSQKARLYGSKSSGVDCHADLKLIGSRYSIITCVFFITYVLLQPPATVVLRKVGPRVFLPTITVLWGITMICFGFAKNWTQMIPLRLVLGIFEAGFFPGQYQGVNSSEVQDANDSQAARICFRAGILATNFRNAMRSST